MMPFKLNQWVKLAQATYGDRRDKDDKTIEEGVLVKAGETVQIFDGKTQDVARPRSSVATPNPEPRQLVRWWRVQKDMSQTIDEDFRESVDGDVIRVPHKDLSTIAGGKPSKAPHKAGTTLYFCNPNPLEYRSNKQARRLELNDKVVLTSGATTRKGNKADTVGVDRAYYSFVVMRTQKKIIEYTWKTDWLKEEELRAH